MGTNGNVSINSAVIHGSDLSYKFFVQHTADAGIVKAVDSRSTGGDWNMGLYGAAYEAEDSRGVYAYGRGTEVSYGVRGRASAQMASRAYGVYGDIQHGANGADIYAGYFSGDVHVTGVFTDPSDAMFKRDVEPLGGSEGGGGSGPSALTMRQSSSGQTTPPRSQAREQLLGLRPVKYHYRRGEYDQMGFPEGEHFGFIAQEVESVLPELVTEAVHPGTEEIGEDGEIVQTGEPLRYKSVNYLGLVPVLVQTAKEQQAEIDALRAEVQALRQLVESGD